MTMAKNNITSVISVDSSCNTVLLCRLVDDEFGVMDEIKCDVKAYNKGFFDSFGQIVKLFRSRFAELDFQKTGIILPDELFFYDTVSIPSTNRRAHGRSLELAIGSLYKNHDELDIHTYSLSQNKQYTTYGLVGIRRDITEALRKACSDNGIELDGVSSRAVCLANGMLAERPRLKNEAFLLLDVEETFSTFVFVLKGQVVGYYDLPLGCSKLDCNILENERLNFECSYAESASVYNSFRVLVKWALELIENNRVLISDASISKVYVNIPEQYKYLLERVNAESRENKVLFCDAADGMPDKAAAKSMGLLGGFYIGRFSKTDVF